MLYGCTRRIFEWVLFGCLEGVGGFVSVGRCLRVSRGEAPLPQKPLPLLSRRVVAPTGGGVGWGCRGGAPLPQFGGGALVGSSR